AYARKQGSCANVDSPIPLRHVHGRFASRCDIEPRTSVDEVGTRTAVQGIVATGDRLHITREVREGIPQPIAEQLIVSVAPGQGVGPQLRGVFAWAADDDVAVQDVVPRTSFDNAPCVPERVVSAPEVEGTASDDNVVARAAVQLVDSADVKVIAGPAIESAKHRVPIDEVVPGLSLDFVVTRSIDVDALSVVVLLAEQRIITFA